MGKIMKTMVIMNPAARKGNSGKRWNEVHSKLSAVLPDHEASITKAPRHATEIARQAIADGYEKIVAIGGDGTLNEVLNGMMENGQLINPRSILCPIPAGTANEVCRSLGLLETSLAPYEAAASGRTRQVDVQFVNCRGIGGEEIQHHSALATSFGSAAKISYDTSQSKFIKKISAELSYYLVTLIVTLTYRPTPLQMQIDDREADQRNIHSGLICNMRYTGGGMDMAPMAVPDDGIFDLIEFGEFGRLDFLTKPPSWLFEGKHIEDPKVSVFQGQNISISGQDDVLVDSDGETIGTLPLKVETRQNALNINVVN